MDKLTIEEKAKRYDEVIGRVVNIKTGKCETTFIFTEGLFDYLFPELEECNEEEVREAMIDFFKHEREEGVVVSHYGVNIERMIAWLEKQGETFTKKDVDDAWLEGMYYAKHELEKQGEQKPADKVEPKDYNSIDPHFGKPADKAEPKFHEGDWVTNGYDTWKIVEVKPLDYILQSQDGNIVDDTISYVDEMFDFFTIQDAKDGDFLACESGGTEFIVILKDISKNGNINSYCRYNTCCGFGIDIPNVMSISNNPKPATKEQRDTLFAAMKEAGYEWDAEKKELKKISQRMISAEAKEAMYGKPAAWSEEDERIFRTIISDGIRGAEFDMLQINWLKSLKQRIKL